MGVELCMNCKPLVSEVIYYDAFSFHFLWEMTAKRGGDWGEGLSSQPIITSLHTTSSSTTLLLNPIGMEYSIMTVLTSVGRVYKHVLGII
jgi:hypothetical protein